ncbi:condensation domain-containing protein [Micromonospora sp. RTGN7]|uniref:condensation domain-containing protein n=1 Tax=Micromonospora sp. RTGN7 TaxID=3016526 RepID=UPI0029FF0E38|nr:condensation domain-containing protein [Micromonospora sp. RTGN7]
MTDLPQVQQPPAADDGTGPVPPRTPYEEAVAAIWHEVLGRSDIGVLDDFFDLDGTSLQAIGVVSRIRKTWQVDVRARDFFESPTIATLAAAVAARAPSGRPPIERRPAEAEPVLSYDQQRLWLEDQLRPGAAYNVHGRRLLTGPLDVAVLERSVRVIVSRHESLRTRFTMADGRPVQVVDDEPGPDWNIDVADLAGVAGDPVEAATRLADEQAAAPFDLAVGPLFRCLLIRVRDDTYVLSITAHHIVCDNWSIGLFVQEFAALYAAGGDPARAGLTPLPIQYRDYAVWQRRWLTGEALEEHVDYWRQHLAGAPAALTLPAGRRRSSGGGRGGRAVTMLTEPDTKAVTELCRAHGATPFMGVLAALATVLGRWSGQSDVVVGVPITGRTDPATGGLIGFFVNTLPLRIGLAGDRTFTELLGAVRGAALGGYAHADAPLDLLVSRLQVPRDPARTPLFQVILNAIDMPRSDSISGVTAEAMETPVPPTKLDVAVSMRETGSALELTLEFDADRYDPATMQLLAEQLAALLRAAAEDPDQDIRDYPL